MKYILALFLSALLLTGCGKQTEKKPVDDKNKYAFDSTDIKTTTAANPNEGFELRYKFEKGKKYNYRLTTIANDVQLLKTDTTLSQKVNQNIIYLFTLTGTNAEDDGTMELDCNVTSVKLDAKAGNQSFLYESGKADSAGRVKFSEYEALINNPFSIRISKIGEIIEIVRVDKILNKYLKLKGYADSVNAEEKNTLRRDISEGAIRPLMVQVFREMPAKTMAKDSTWIKTQPPGQFMIFKSQNSNIYKVENLEMLDNNKIAVINAELETILSGNSKFTDKGVSYEFQKPVTTSSGKIFFNISSGLIQKSRTRTLVDLSYTMEAPTPKGKQKGSKKETIENVNILELL